MDGKGKQIRMLMGRVVVKKESSTGDQLGEESSDDDLVFEQNQMESCVESDFFMESNKKKRVVVSSGGGGGGGKRVSNGVSSGAAAGCGGGGGLRICQAENCTADLTDVKPYHRRHKVCEFHAKAQAVLVGGTRQRFCQQCSRFHELSEFDDTKRSCRRRLAGHNERRRKTAADFEGSSRKGNGTHGTQLSDMVYGQVDDRGRIKITIQENATYKQFQIR